LLPAPGFTSPATQTPGGLRGGERLASASQRRAPSAVCASSIRPPVRLGPTSLSRIVARSH
jgi:hypothetical protein